MDPRLPAHLEVSGLIRAVEAVGGFATVLAKGERDAGTVLIVTLDREHGAMLYERMPTAGGDRPYIVAKRENRDSPREFADYIVRRRHQDPDCWIVELDMPDAARFIADSIR